jgi:hypothetical protein
MMMTYVVCRDSRKFNLISNSHEFSVSTSASNQTLMLDLSYENLVIEFSFDCVSLLKLFPSATEPTSFCVFSVFASKLSLQPSLVARLHVVIKINIHSVFGGEWKE